MIALGLIVSIVSLTVIGGWPFLLASAILLVVILFGGFWHIKRGQLWVLS